MRGSNGFPAVGPYYPESFLATGMLGGAMSWDEDQTDNASTL